jgi:ribosomal protein L37E
MALWRKELGAEMTEREKLKLLAKCAVCGQFSFEVEHERCPVCGWIHDHLQESKPRFRPGPNRGICLNAYKKKK